MANTTYTVFTSNAGHSAKSPGAGANGFKEHEQARLCNDAFIKVMKAHGHNVINTTSDAANKIAVLQEQVAKANRVGGSKNQLDISFHLNSGGGSGVEVLYYSDDVKPIAASISSAISKELGVKDRGIKQRKDLYFLKHTKANAILVEVCFVDSLIDMQKLLKKRNKVMTAVAEALVGPFESSTDQSTPSTPQSTYTGPSLVDYLKSIKVDSSFANRSRLAVTYEIVKTTTQYKGTATQNTKLLEAMRGSAK